MKLNIPIAMTRFRCKADKCKDSCCIGWEIDINSTAEALYRTLPGEIGTRVRRGIEPSHDDECAHFILDAQGRCPMLNEDGLCSLIIEGGDGLLTEICREHPRYYNRYSDYAEMGLGLACEAAAELILSAKTEELSVIQSYDDEDIVHDIELPELGELIEERAGLFKLALDSSVGLSDTFYKMMELEDSEGEEVGYSALAEILSRLEAIDSSYPARITEAASLADRDRNKMLEHLFSIANSSGRTIIFAELHRHYLDSVYMLDRQERISYAFVFLLSVALLCFGCNSKDELIEATVLTAKNLDYSTENTEALLDALSCNALTPEMLLYLLGG